MLAFALFLLALGARVIPAIPARHSGTCPECRNPIRIDELIVETAPKRWVHEECVPTGLEENWAWPERGRAA